MTTHFERFYIIMKTHKINRDREFVFLNLNKIIVIQLRTERMERSNKSNHQISNKIARREFQTGETISVEPTTFSSGDRYLVSTCTITS